MRFWKLFADGSSKGNPGRAGIGVVLLNPEGRTVVCASEPIGVATNNIAEYKALIRGMEIALKSGAEYLQVCADSELLVKQLTGEYKVRAPNLLPLHNEVRRLQSQFRAVEYRHVPRGANEDADKLASQAAEEGN